ncbi:hypothetical protein BDZ45DRAFT_672761 [Acephala macrosclerotiorum]|nr:hypothetical protein BDZ45DRAFT_672761 [Acephala macrosclerotiorum]
MENWASPNRKNYIVLACITCEGVILLTRKEILGGEETEAPTINLFVPTVCSSCEEGKEVLGLFGSSNRVSAKAVWTSLSISYGMIRTWQPFLAMKDFLKGELSVPTTKVNLAQRDEVKRMVGSGYMVQSVVLDHNTVQAHPYLQCGFF